MWSVNQEFELSPTQTIGLNRSPGDFLYTKFEKFSVLQPEMTAFQKISGIIRNKVFQKERQFLTNSGKTAFLKATENKDSLRCPKLPGYWWIMFCTKLLFLFPRPLKIWIWFLKKGTGTVVKDNMEILSSYWTVILCGTQYDHDPHLAWIISQGLHKDSQVNDLKDFEVLGWKAWPRHYWGHEVKAGRTPDSAAS